MKINCPYLGLATKIKITPIPRIIMAVLKLLAPTNPTTGRIISIIFIMVRIFPMSFTFFVTIWARNRIKATLANSDG